MTEPVGEIVSRWKDAYVPTYTPTGFAMSDAINTGNILFLEYANSNGDRISVYQYGENNNIRLDTENAGTIQSCEIGTKPGQIYTKGEMSTLYWSNGERSFSIEFKSSIVTWDEIVEMAESMEQ